MIVAESSFLGGFSLYVENGHLKHTYSLLGLKLDTISSRDSVPAGKVNVRYEFTADKPGEFGTGGTSRLFINGKQQAEVKMEHSVPFRFASYEGMDIGTDNGLPVVPKFEYAESTAEIFQRHDRKSRIRSRPGETKCRRSPTDLSPTLRQRSSQLIYGRADTTVSVDLINYLRVDSL